MPTYTEYRDEINYIFSHYTRKGFVDYRNCRDLEFDMTRLLEDATRALSEQLAETIDELLNDEEKILSFVKANADDIEWD